MSKNENIETRWHHFGGRLFAWFAVQLQPGRANIAKVADASGAGPAEALPLQAVSHYWVAVFPGGKVDHGTNSPTLEICWDKACWPAFTREYLESKGWSCVRKEREMQAPALAKLPDAGG